METNCDDAPISALKYQRSQISDRLELLRLSLKENNIILDKIRLEIDGMALDVEKLLGEANLIDAAILVLKSHGFKEIKRDL